MLPIMALRTARCLLGEVDLLEAHFISDQMQSHFGFQKKKKPEVLLRVVPEGSRGGRSRVR